MKHNNFKRIIFFLCLVLSLALCAGITPNVQAENVFPLTVKIYNPNDGTTSEKTFANADDKLGYGIDGGGRSHWSYKTFRKIFIGWSLDAKFADPAAVNSMSSNDKIYRDIESIAAILADASVDENTVLYPVIIPVTDLASLVLSLSNGGGKCYLNIAQPDEVLFEKNDFIKESYGLNDLTASERKIVSYFDENTQSYGLHGTAEFRYSDLRIPALIIENPLSVIRSARGITDFSGVSPTDYTYEDIHITVDPKATTSVSQKNWTLSSSTFMVAAVLDTNGNALTMTSLTQPDAHSLQSVFSFENPNQIHEFIVRTVVRNDNGDGKYGDNDYPSNNITTLNGRDLFKEMTLNTGDFSNITISKEKATEAVLNNGSEVEFVFDGSTNGKISIDKKNLTGGAALIAFFLPNNQPIGNVTSTNKTIIDFVPSVVRFDRNSTSLGDTEEQNLGYSRVALNAAMDTDIFNDGKQPDVITNMGDSFCNLYALNDKIIFNGQSAYFQGWNTKADGSGVNVDVNTVIGSSLFNTQRDADLVLYAQWKNKFKATHTFVSQTPNKTLPNDVINLLPGDITDLQDGASVNAAQPSQIEVAVREGKWVFKGYTPSSATVNGSDVLFEGKWIFVPNGTQPVTPGYVVPPTSAQ